MATSVLAFLFVLGVLIFVHELGHFLMAKRIGVRVLTFALGFGPRLVGFRRGDTDYCVRALPLGGYVKMAGETPDDPRTGRPDEFMSKTKWQRFQVMIMGPVMNVVLAVVVLWLVLLQGTEVPLYIEQPVVVGAVTAGSPAEQVGIKAGDRILSISGETVDTWDQFFSEVAPNANRELVLTLLREGREMSVTVTPNANVREFHTGDLGVLPEMHPQIRRVTKDEPADRAGIQPGDVVLAVDGTPVSPQKPLVEIINKNAGTALTFTIRRNGAPLDLQVTPAKKGDVGLIGVELSQFEMKMIQPGAIEALGLSVDRNIKSAGLILESLGKLVTGRASPKQLVGPIGIAQISGSAAQQGWAVLFEWMAMISLNLGLINLLPIPILDGGQIFIMALEGAARRDFSIKVKEKIFLAGFVVIMMLMVTVLYNDLMRISFVEKLMPWR